MAFLLSISFSTSLKTQEKGSEKERESERKINTKFTHHYSWGMVKKAVANCEKAKRKGRTDSILSLGNASMHDHDRTQIHLTYICLALSLLINLTHQIQDN
jgi:hypothetical protein